MRIRRWAATLLVAGLLLGALSGEARAHFLFVKIGPFDEGGRHAEVTFSEQADAGDAKFVDKIAGTSLWAQTAPGRFRPLVVRKGVDRLRALVPASGALSVVGVCEYGVIARPGQTPFLLRYYPKAIAGAPDALSRLVPRAELALEIAATIEADRLKLVLLRSGKPVPNAVFHAVDADLTESSATAGTDGVATWTPPSTGDFSIYARDDLKQAGSLGGASYEEIREFATLALAWPLERKEADAGAVALWEDALQARAEWRDFPGFSARVAGAFDGTAFSGTMTVDETGAVTVETENQAARRWLIDQFESIAMHRIASDATSAATKPRDPPVLRFGDDDEGHPLGRLLIFEGGQFASSYRVKDHQIMVVNRKIGSKTMTITVLDNDPTPDKHFLPRSYLVHYWDGGSGALDRVETIQERWRRIGSWDLPTRHDVSTASNAGLSVRSVQLSDHKMRGPE